ncbi:hypothetical protein ExPUPEC04_04671 [Escherichia coli]|nr:hypothetical protein ExPUPEC04_04671 [Escherichia coli]
MPYPKINSSSSGITTAISQLLGSRTICRVSLTHSARTRRQDRIGLLIAMLLIPVVDQLNKGLLHRGIGLLIVGRLRFQIVRCAAGD